MAFFHLCFLSLISVAGIHTFLSLLAILLQKWTITLNCMMPFSLSFVFPQTPTSHGLLSYFSLVFFFSFLSTFVFFFSLYSFFFQTPPGSIYIYINYFFSFLFLSWPNSNSDLLYYKILSLFNSTGCYFGKKKIINCCLFDCVSFSSTHMLP
jgi:hypothetical protein